MAAKFRASQGNVSDPVGLNIQLRLELEYRGPQTTFNVHEIDVAELPLNEDGLYGFFSGVATKTGERISLETGYSGIVTCSVNGRTMKAIQDVPSEISGYIVFRETHTGNLPKLAFRAAREA
jgi:hypothetical protein